MLNLTNLSNTDLILLMITAILLFGFPIMLFLLVKRIEELENYFKSKEKKNV